MLHSKKIWASSLGKKYCWAGQIWIVKLNLKMKNYSPFLECLNYLCTEKSVNWLDLSFFCSLYVFRLWNGCLIAAHFRTGRPSAGLRGLFSTMARITEFCRNISPVHVVLVSLLVNQLSSLFLPFFGRPKKYLFSLREFLVSLWFFLVDQISF